MNIKLLMVGKNNEDFIREGINHYSSKVKYYSNFEIKIISESKLTNQIEENRKKEGVNILKNVSDNDFLIILDEQGKEYTSRQWAGVLEKKIESNIKNIVFLIGGAYGFSPDVYQRANEKLSLSKMTCSHQLIRLFFLEQLYRSFTIMKGLPYHHD